MRRQPALPHRVLAVLSVLATAGDPLQAQGATSEPAAVFLTAYVAPSLSFVDVASAPVVQANDTLLVTRRITTTANIARSLVVRLGDPAPPGVEIRDRHGAWVPLTPDAGVEVFRSEELGTLSHLVECRTTADATADVRECPLSFELASRDPSYPMRVTARPAVMHAAR